MTMQKDIILIIKNIIKYIEKSLKIRRWLEMSNNKEDVNIYEMYSKEAQITKDEFIKIYNVKDEGLTTLEAEKNFINSD